MAKFPALIETSKEIVDFYKMLADLTPLLPFPGLTEIVVYLAYHNVYIFFYILYRFLN